MHEGQSQYSNPELWAPDLQTVLPFLNQNIPVVLWFKLLLLIVGWGLGAHRDGFLDNFFLFLEEVTGSSRLAWRQGTSMSLGSQGHLSPEGTGLSLPGNSTFNIMQFDSLSSSFLRMDLPPLKSMRSPRPLRAGALWSFPLSEKERASFLPPFNLGSLLESL